METCVMPIPDFTIQKEGKKKQVNNHTVVEKNTRGLEDQ